MPRLLVSGMGGASGYAVGRLAADLGFDPLYGDHDPQTPALLLHPERAVLLPAAGDPHFLDELDAVCRRYGITHYSPNVDAEIACLATPAAAGLRSRVRVWLPADDIVACCLDKEAFARFVEACAPDLALRRYTSADALTRDFPDTGVVVKPRSSSGGKGVVYCHTAQEAEAALGSGPDLLAQEWLHGDEFSADCLTETASGPGRDRSLVHLRLRNRTRAGMSTVTEAFVAPDLVKRLTELLHDLRFAGPSCVQGFLSPAGPRITEVNVRFGGGCALSQLSGGRLVETYLTALLHDTPIPAGELQYQPGARLVRTLDFEHIPARNS